MTGQEHMMLVDICNEYWHDFSKLIAETLAKAPLSLHEHLLMMLQDKSSVYGSKYDEYLKQHLNKIRNKP